MKRHFTREQRTTVVNGILCLVLILVVLQLWLLMATMNAYLGGDDVGRLAGGAGEPRCLGLNARPAPLPLRDRAMSAP